MTLHNHTPFGQPFVETHRVFGELLVLEVLLASAEERFLYTRDEKTYTTLENIFLLLRNGAQPEGLNRYQVGGMYLHEVLWEDAYLFVTTTKKEVDFAEVVLKNGYVN